MHITNLSFTSLKNKIVFYSDSLIDRRQRGFRALGARFGIYFNGSVKFAAGCDDIIRQHKAACLRVTALLACNELLWIGTSAGVLLTVPIPHIKPSTQRMSQPPIVTGAY